MVSATVRARASCGGRVFAYYMRVCRGPLGGIFLFLIVSPGLYRGVRLRSPSTNFSATRYAACMLDGTSSPRINLQTPNHRDHSRACYLQRNFGVAMIWPRKLCVGLFSPSGPQLRRPKARRGLRFTDAG
jgi:hypothetical protein